MGSLLGKDRGMRGVVALLSAVAQLFVGPAAGAPKCSADADLEQLDLGGRSVLHHCADRGKWEDHLGTEPPVATILELIKKGAVVDKRDWTQHTPLHYAAGSNGHAHIDTVKVLIENGA